MSPADGSSRAFPEAVDGTAPAPLLYKDPSSPASRLRDAPHPRTADECREWAARYRETHDPALWNGLAVSACLLASKVASNELAHRVKHCGQATRAYLKAQAEDVRCFAVIEALAALPRWDPDRASLGTYLWPRIEGAVTDCYNRAADAYLHEALTGDDALLDGAANRGQGHHRAGVSGSSDEVGLSEDALYELGEDAADRGRWLAVLSDPTADSIRFRDEAQLCVLVKRLCSDIVMSRTWNSAEKAIITHQLLPMARGRGGLADAELAERLGYSRWWVVNKRRQILAQLRATLAEQGVTSTDES